MDLHLEKQEPGDVGPPRKRVGWAKFQAYFRNPHKKVLIYSMAGLVLIVMTGYFLFLRNIDFNMGEFSSKEKGNAIPITDMTYDAPLDGIKTDLASSQRHPLAIMVENHPDARPQSGLSKASVIYEAIAEGGITRFLAIFGTFEADKIGPIRSARPYYVDWVLGYNAYYSHVGGNATALDQIKSDKVLDLSQFAYPKPYSRDKSLKVSSEHTMFASTVKLREQAETNGYTKDNSFSTYKYKDDPAKDSAEYTALPESQKVTVDYSSAGYKVSFEYDKTTNSYKRFLAGIAHKDRTTGEQLAPKNIAVISLSRIPLTTRINEHGYSMQTVGEGVANIFQGGKMITGTWKKSSKTSREIFYNEAGEEITFNRGQLMICVMSKGESTLTVNDAKI